MTATLCDKNGAVANALTDAVRAAIDSTYSAICGEKPIPTSNDTEAVPCPCVAGIISFVGDVPWSLSWILTPETAPHLANKLTGFDIPFTSPDMGDFVAELVNILAGDVIVELERRRMKAQMTLPTVARGTPLEILGSAHSTVTGLAYTSKQGAFWLRIICPQRGGHIGTAHPS